MAFKPRLKPWLFQGFLTPSLTYKKSYDRWFRAQISNTSTIENQAGQSYDAVNLFAHGIHHLIKAGKDFSAPGALMNAYKAVQFPSVLSVSPISILPNGEIDAPYFLYNFRRYNASTNCPPGEVCSDEVILHEGWDVVGQLAAGAQPPYGYVTLKLEGPVRGCECVGLSDSSQDENLTSTRGMQCQVWSVNDYAQPWCYVNYTCSDPTISWRCLSLSFVCLLCCP